MDLFFIKHKIFYPIFFGNLDLSISNFSLSVMLLPLLFFSLMAFGMRKLSYYPAFLQNGVELVCEKLSAIFSGYLGKKGEKYIPFLMCLMFFILILNLGNLIPGVFACTSQLSLTLTLGLIVFGLITAIGFIEHGYKFFLHFIPHGIPMVLKPFLFVLELFSFCIRPVSLALRLSINMVAGHVMLHVIAVFIPEFNYFSLISIAISSVLSIFEICVAALQAYVFAVLSCIYIADIMNGHE